MLLFAFKKLTVDKSQYERLNGIRVELSRLPIKNRVHVFPTEDGRR